MQVRSISFNDLVLKLKPYSLIPNSPLSGIKQHEDHIDKLVYLKNLRRSTSDVTNYQLLEIIKVIPAWVQRNH